MGAIRLTGLSKAYRHGPRAVDDVSLEISDGEFMALVAPSGCGKSTLLRGNVERVRCCADILGRTSPASRSPIHHLR